MVYILIPVFNEEENIPALAENLLTFFNVSNLNAHFIFVDDFSTDNTINSIKSFFKESNYTVIEKSSNIGPGDSFNRGFNWIIENAKKEDRDNDIVITMEADNTCDLNILPIMISLAQQKIDLVLASVYAQGGGFEKTGFIRVVLSFCANLFFRSFFNLKILTLPSFYRVYRLELICKIKENNKEIIHEKGFISMLEILIKSIKLDATVIEVPMRLKSLNRKGKSKMKLMKTTLSYIRFLFKSEK